MEEDHEEVEGGGAAAGWPLGLPPVTLQMQRQFANAFSTALHPSHYTAAFLLATPTSCSSDLESSDLDTESSLFSFQARSITLGSLMGMRSMTEPNLIRARSLAVASSCSQVSTLQYPVSHHHQSFHVLELLCRKLVMQRQQFKRIATDSAKLCNNFFVRCTACVQAQLCHKQTRGSSMSCRRAQPVKEDVVDASSLAHLLQMDRESCSIMLPTQHHTVFMDIMCEGV